MIALLICNTETKPQVLKFINEVYSLGPVEDDLYTSKAISLSDIFANILQCSNYFNNRTLNSFSSFCGRNKLNFMEGNPSKRLKNEAGTFSRQWNLYVLEENTKVK